MSSDLFKRLESKLAETLENQMWSARRSESNRRQEQEELRRRRRRAPIPQATPEPVPVARRHAAQLEVRAPVATPAPIAPAPTVTGVTLDTAVPHSFSQNVDFSFTGSVPSIVPEFPTALAPTPLISSTATPSASQATAQASSSSSSLSQTALIGIIAGSIVGAITIVTLLACLFARRRRRQEPPAIIANCIERKESYSSLNSAGTNHSGQSAASNPFADDKASGRSARSTRPPTINTTASRHNKAYLPPVPEEGSPAMHSPLRPAPLRINLHTAKSRSVDAPLETALLPSPSQNPFHNQNPFNTVRIPFLSSNRASVQSSIYSGYSESDAASIATSRRESNIHPAYRKWRDSLWSVGASTRRDSRMTNVLPTNLHTRNPSSENLLSTDGAAAATAPLEFKGRLSSVDSFAQTERDARAGVLAADKPKGATRERQRSSATIFKAHPGNLVSF